MKFISFALLAVCVSTFLVVARADDQASDGASITANVEAEVAATEPAPPSTQAYDLQYKFAPGEVVRTEVIHRVTYRSTIQGVSVSNENQAKSIKVWQIKDVTADGQVTFVHMLESIDMWQKTQGAKMETYNSETDSDPPQVYEEAARSVGVPLTTITMETRGKILKRFEKRPQHASMSTQMVMPLPDAPVKVGQTWSVPMDIDVTLKDGSVKKVRSREQFKLSKVAADVATIDVETQILTPISDPEIEGELIQKLSKGSFRFDIAAGRVLGKQLDLDRHVVGFMGPSTSLHYVSRSSERLLSPGEQTARRTGPKSEPIRAK